MRYLRADALDAGTWELVARLFSDPSRLQQAWEEWREQGDDAGPTRIELERVEAEAERLSARRERLLAVYLDGGTTAALYRTHRDELEQRLEELRQERRGLNDELESLDNDAAFQTLETFAEAVGDEIAATETFAERAWYVDTLDVQVVIGLDRMARVSAHGVRLGEFGPL